MKLFGVEYVQTPARAESGWDGTRPNHGTHPNLLACPICSPYEGQEGCLHHEGVHVFNRKGYEDSSTGLVVSINDQFGKLTSGGDTHTHNPSARRNGILVEFWCEICGSGLDGQAPLYLAIAQHKGQTELSWFVAK